MGEKMVRRKCIIHYTRNERIRELQPNSEMETLYI
jgi:hypothetical protein